MAWRWACAGLFAVGLLPACHGSDDAKEKDGAQGKFDKPVPLRRLTRVQYEFAVADLLGIASEVSDALPPDDIVAGFATNTVSSTSAARLRQYMTTAETLAERAAPSTFDEIVSCDVAQLGTAKCIERFVHIFGRRAYRRPLTAREKSAYQRLFAEISGKTDQRTGIEVLISTFLQSPHFLYRHERRPEPGAEPRRLNGYELASRLSLLIWASIPDDALLDAAAAGKLDTAEGLRNEAERLLANKRAARGLASFHRQWLELTELDQIIKYGSRFPQFTDALRSAMLREAGDFADTVIRSADGSLRRLLTASFTIAEPALAKLYEAPHPGTGAARVALDPRRRSGILTLASVMAAHAHPDDSAPVQRGSLIRRRLLCTSLHPPPPSVDMTPPAFDPKQSRREQFASHSKSPACRGCHHLMDPLGFGFEHYDGIGAYRSTDGGKEVDASGSITGSQDLDGRAS